ncbi:hypothetical protein [Enterovibrio norvegicus]|uniref:hypothetical protein n=1 Tax=Enterovibrio norvegicus TaxID=188144 RepID=UPI000C822D7E|nr:hypothetical protein [Enterovibrio norvegicus]PML77190.1 hypothetical protein BCT69_21020 [Enterovibrio norvegicus]
MSTEKTKSLITAPIASIIITLTICFTALFAMGSFEQPKQDYATVHFDGGYKKIGVISEQRSFSEAEVIFNDKTLWSGTMSYVANEIKKSIASEKNPETITWKSGVILNGTAGVSWVGSESSFELTTETINLLSTEDSPLVAQQVIDQLLALDRKIKDESQASANQALTLSEPPSASFTFTKLITALRNI